MSHRTRFVFLTIAPGLLTIAIAAAAVVMHAKPRAPQPPARRHLFNRHAVALSRSTAREAPRVDADHSSGPQQEQYDNRAYPAAYIGARERDNAHAAFKAILNRGHAGGVGGGTTTFAASGPIATSGAGVAWEELGPFTPTVPGEANYTGRTTTNSGRVTSLAIGSTCNMGNCVLFVGAAGGGIWKTANALDNAPSWVFTSGDIPSNAIGSIAIDPTDPSGSTIYAGTGEPNGSGDSEAGVGLYKSTNGGQTWTLVAGSLAVSRDRSIGAVAIDPRNAQHVFIGTAVARHGSSSVNGGRFSPPGAPTIGVYESTNGGASFSLVLSLASDVVNPSTANGSDFFRGGVSGIQTNRVGLAANDPTQIYVSVFDYGLYRSKTTGGFEQVFASAGGGLVANSLSARTEFALATKNNKLRIYLGDAGAGAADFYRVDDANVPAGNLTNGSTNFGWTKLSNSSPGTPGFGSYNFCGDQCSYDMPVASPPGQPDVVWIGGSMQYDEIFTLTPPSNGRTVQRSTDAGVTFTDMTNDRQTPLPIGMHPDQHAMAFAPSNPNIAFLGSDGGVVRTSGAFADASGDCAGRGISGADMLDCTTWLKSIPTKITSLNDGLRTLQFQSVSVDAHNPTKNLLGGTQDNGTWAYTGTASSWFESVGGDGGQSGIDSGDATVRMHTYFDPQGDVNFRTNDPLGWNWFADPLLASKEDASFYVPLINDPTVAGTWFIGLQHVWRTKDNAGPQAYLEQHCNEFTGDFRKPCGDWQALGGGPGDLTKGPDSDKGTGYVVAIERAQSDGQTMWVATRRGRLFVTQNADAIASQVKFNRIDTSAQPRRFISGISVDPADRYHAFVSFSGYNAYTPTTPGHVFEVRFNATTNTATWTDLSYDLGDQPITGIAYDPNSGSVYASTDFGVLILPPAGQSWSAAGTGLPQTAVFGITIDEASRVLYAATHGRGIWRLALQ